MKRKTCVDEVLDRAQVIHLGIPDVEALETLQCGQGARITDYMTVRPDRFFGSVSDSIFAVIINDEPCFRPQSLVDPALALALIVE